MMEEGLRRRNARAQRTNPNGIVQYPDDRLTQVSEPLLPSDGADALAIAAALRMALNHSAREGIGLAAPQIGINRRVFILDAVHLGINSSGVFINPEITESSTETEDEEEGCLSLPEGFTTLVQRPSWIRISFVNAYGSQMSMQLRGLAARAACHETDHLDGKLITRFMTRQMRRQLERLCS